MPETILVAIITGIFTLIGGITGALISYFQGIKTQNMANHAEHERRIADYWLQKEADALTELLETAERCHAIADNFANGGWESPGSDEIEREAMDALAEFESAINRSAIFLDEEQEETLYELRGAVVVALEYGQHQQADRKRAATAIMDWGEHYDDFKDVQKMLREEIQERIKSLNPDTNE